MSISARLAPLSGAAGIALLDVGWFWDPTPPTDWTNGQLDSYFATHADVPWLVVSVVQLLAVPFVWRFATVLRHRLAAGGASDRVARLAGGAGRVFAITVLVFAVCYAAIPFTKVFSDVAPPSAEVYRFWFAGTFSLYIAFSTLSVVAMIGAVGTAAFRSRAVPVGLGVAGVPLAVIVLAQFMLPMAGITLWFLAASITLAVRPLRTTAASVAAAPRAPVTV